jgi:segregation and condensation protein B
MSESQENPSLPPIIEAALLAAGRPLSVKDLMELFAEAERPAPADVEAALETLNQQCESRPVELVKVASGYRLQVRSDYSIWVSRLWEERAPRYSRALMETMAIIAYRQPVTRGDIEDVRGVSVSSTIMRTLLDRRWIRTVGNRDVPGRPALYGTTREFLDYFGLEKLADLPELDELRDLDEINVELDFGPSAATAAVAGEEGDGDQDGSADGDDAEGAVGAHEDGAQAQRVPSLATVTPIRPELADAGEEAAVTEADHDASPEHQKEGEHEGTGHAQSATSPESAEDAEDAESADAPGSVRAVDETVSEGDAQPRADKSD